MDNIYIYNMTLSDLELLSENLLTDFDDFWNISTLKNELLNNNSKYIVAKNQEKEFLGFGGIWKSVETIHITNIVVRKDLRKLGIGSFILDKLIDISKKHYTDITSITLEVNYKNIPAIKLYEKYGFKNVGIRKNYYKGVDDAIIMTLEVTNEKK